MRSLLPMKPYRNLFGNAIRNSPIRSQTPQIFKKLKPPDISLKQLPRSLDACELIVEVAWEVCAGVPLVTWLRSHRPPPLLAVALPISAYAPRASSAVSALCDTTGKDDGSPT